MGEDRRESFENHFDQSSVPGWRRADSCAAAAAAFEQAFRNQTGDGLVHRLGIDVEFRSQLQRGGQRAGIDSGADPPPEFVDKGWLFEFNHEMGLAVFSFKLNITILVFWRKCK